VDLARRRQLYRAGAEVPGDLRFGAEVIASRHEVSLADARMMLLRISAVARELDDARVCDRRTDLRSLAADLLAACDHACTQPLEPDAERFDERPRGGRPTLRIVDNRDRHHRDLGA
jgi:hypothetical protein